MKFGKKLAILPKQNLIENLYKKKYLKAEKKKSTQKKAFIMLVHE